MTDFTQLLLPSIIKSGLTYVTSRLSSSSMNYIYQPKVLIEGEEPPTLLYQAYIFIALEISTSAIVYMLSKAVINNEELQGLFRIITYIYIGVISTTSVIIAYVMMMKKYFLYKDDGLRAIRALETVLMMVSSTVHMMITFLVIYSFGNPNSRLVSGAFSSVANRLTMPTSVATSSPSMSYPSPTRNARTNNRSTTTSSLRTPLRSASPFRT